MKTSKRTTILLIILLLVGALSYPVIKKNFDSSEEEVATTPVISGQVGQTMQQIEKVQLDTQILSSTDLTRLRDWSLPLPNIPVGKSNPFLK